MARTTRMIRIPTSRLGIMSPEFIQLLSDIDPAVKPANSRKLKQWMALYGRPGDTVYSLRSSSCLAEHVGEGALFIGQPYNDDSADKGFSGTLLRRVLCMGTQAKRSSLSHEAPSMVEVAGFWASYLEIGRCAVDPRHELGFRDTDRFEVVGANKVCKWCSTLLPIDRLAA